ncbi:MAG TPA: amidohydrolase [Vicinamibacterales bacterium]|nr:amidohydrolase [Vicinamibacterales bacterium]
MFARFAGFARFSGFSRFAACVAAVTAVGVAGQQPAPADLVVVNGRVFTGAGSPRQEAVAVRGSQIVAVGARSSIEALKGPSTSVVDAGGAAVLPGFNDSHVHFLSGAQSLQELDLSGARTLEEVLQKIREFAAANPGAPWIRGRGWNYGAFPDGLPTRAQLDRALPDRPAVLVCFDGHSSWVNSKALQAARIDSSTADPPNGAITRIGNTREPDGLLKESAQGLVRKVMPEPSRAEKRRAIAAGIELAHSIGVTSIQNASGNDEEFAVYEEARAAGELPLRVYSSLSVSPGFTEADADRFDAIRRRIANDDRFKAGAVKLLVDGVIETNTAVMLAPYVNNPATRGVPNYPAPELDRIVRMLDARGWQIFVHAIGDGGVRMTLDAFERAAKANPPPARGRRHRVEHIETIDLADVPRFGALGVIASMQPPHTRLMNSPNPRGQWAGNIGPERQARGWMWKDIRERGGRLAFGSDWPVASLNPLTGIWIGLNRIGHGSVASQRLSLDEMIDGYTAGAAYAAFDEDRKGRLAPGQLADIVVLTRDIFAAPPTAADDVQVRVTIFDGRVVYRR